MGQLHSYLQSLFSQNLSVIRHIYQFWRNLFLRAYRNSVARGGNDWGMLMIQTLRLSEKARLDKNRLSEIVARLGSRGADDLISRTMEELAVQLAKVHKGFARGSTHEVHMAARKISEFSAHVGMPSLSAVASDVTRLAQENDGAAFAATVARLGRIGESSLMKVWDLQDLSM